MFATCEMCDMPTEHASCTQCDNSSQCQRCLSCWECGYEVEYERCRGCGKTIDTNNDAFTMIDSVTYECWNCYGFPPGR